MALTANPDQIVREVIQNELSGQVNDPNLWCYRKGTTHDGKTQVLEYCQTKNGTIHRLLAVNGQPLNLAERRAEEIRIQKLIRSPNAVEAAQRKETADGREERKFLKLLPDAFSYRVEGRQGDRLTLRFTPNPNFRASGNEERVLHALSGAMVVDLDQKRLVSISGRLSREVKFWGGLAGHLDPGGTFSVTQENVASGDWELKTLDVEMNGKALLFKTIAVREHESYSNYTPVPPNISLAQAAEHLERDSDG